MVSAVSFSALGAFFEFALVSATGVADAVSLLAAGNLFAAPSGLASESCCAQVRVAKQQKLRIAAEAKREVRRNADWSFIVCPQCEFEATCKTFPAGKSPGSQSTILRVAELRGLRNETGTTHCLASRGYHISQKHSLVLGSTPGKPDSSSKKRSMRQNTSSRRSSE